MNASELHRRAMELFDQACELPPAERKTLLAEACAGNAELQRKVEGMLRQDAATDGLSDTGAVEAIQQLALQVTESDFASDGPPTTIGAYRIVQQVGHGGMGVIYEATQESPHRRVALKVVRSGILSREMLRRFQREAHVLGQLQHAGIAQIYEAGVAETGAGRRPYFAMEFIDGLPLDRHVESHHLTTSMRLELVARVCDAVQYAHQKGIIHRDLKPANVLVVAPATADADRPTRGTTLVDSIGLPKVLDFGIARFADADAHAVTAHTEIGQFIGTLAYMSPEQIAGNHADLDTRCDVYALGVMLYELLSGRRPHEITGLSPPEAARVVRDEEPTRLGALDRSFKGDIETIVAKAMEKDRERRYGAAAELAADIRRYLNDEPIDARPASAFYQLSKFAKRNRALVIGVCATFATLILGLAGTTHYLRRAQATNQRLESVVQYQTALLENIDPAEMGQNIFTNLRTEAAAGLGAEDERRDEKLADFELVLSQMNATEIANRALDHSILSRAVAVLDRDFADQIDLQTDLRSSLVGIYSRLGLYGEAVAQARRLQDTLLAQAGPDAPETLNAWQQVCQLTGSAKDYEAAETAARSLLEAQRRILGPEAPETLVTQGLLGSTLTSLTRWDEAEPLLQSAVDGLTRVLGASDPRTLQAQTEFAVLHRLKGDLQTASDILVDILNKEERAFGPDHRNTLLTLGTLAQVCYTLKDYEKAQGYFERALTARKRINGADHPDTLALQDSAAINLMALNRNDEAAAILRDTFERRKRVSGADNPATISTLGGLARLMVQEKNWPEAEAYARERLAIAERNYGPQNLKTLIARADIATVLQKSGQIAAAVDAARETAEAYEAAFGPTSRQTLTLKQFYAKTLMSDGRLADADAVLDDVLEVALVDYADTSLTAGSLGKSVTCKVQLGQGAAAIERANALLDWCTRRQMPPEVMGKAHCWLARAQLLQGDLGAAAEAARTGLEEMAKFDETNPTKSFGELIAAGVAARLGRPDLPAAEGAMERLRAGRDTLLPEEQRLWLAEGESYLADVQAASQTAANPARP